MVEVGYQKSQCDQSEWLFVPTWRAIDDELLM